MSVFERPWRTLTDDMLTPSALTAPGWLLPVERKLLWWIGSSYWTGAGAIIDAGAFCGASAASFASGVRASTDPGALQRAVEARRSLTGSQHGPVVSFDKFVQVDSFEREFIEEAFGARLTGDDAFLDYYLRAVQPYLDLIRVEAGDFLKKKWNGQPIEVLFLDLCKTRALNAHAIAEFLPHLIPGRSLLIQQDFMGVWLPHINWCMEYLKEYFEIVDPECGPSRVYLLKEAIPQSLIDTVVQGALSLEERLGLLDQLRKDSLADGAPGVAMLAQGMKLQELVLEGKLAEHDAMWAHFLVEHGIPSDATEGYFSGEQWVYADIPNWIPRQLMTMRATRLATW